MNRQGETGRYPSIRYKFDVIFSSPYHRALQTADDITFTLHNSPRLVMEKASDRLNLESSTDSPARASRQDFLKRISAANEKAIDSVDTLAILDPILPE